MPQTPFGLCIPNLCSSSFMGTWHPSASYGTACCSGQRYMRFLQTIPIVKCPPACCSGQRHMRFLQTIPVAKCPPACCPGQHHMGFLRQMVPLPLRFSQHFCTCYCRMVKAIRFFATSTDNTFTLTTSPTCNTSSGCLMNRSVIWEMCTRPS